MSSMRIHSNDTDRNTASCEKITRMVMITMIVVSMNIGERDQAEENSAASCHHGLFGVSTLSLGVQELKQIPYYKPLHSKTSHRGPPQSSLNPKPFQRLCTSLPWAEERVETYAAEQSANAALYYTK